MRSYSRSVMWRSEVGPLRTAGLVVGDGLDEVVMVEEVENVRRVARGSPALRRMVEVVSEGDIVRWCGVVVSYWWLIGASC